MVTTTTTTADGYAISALASEITARPADLDNALTGASLHDETAEYAAQRLRDCILALVDVEDLVAATPPRTEAEGTAP
jgi:hypothetical protein